MISSKVPMPMYMRTSSFVRQIFPLEGALKHRLSRDEPCRKSYAAASAWSSFSSPSSSSSRVIVNGGATMITFQCVIR